jgi:cobalamin synthase
MVDDAKTPDEEKGASVTLPRLRDPLVALAALTALPLPRPDPRGSELARASLFFPLVGFLIGALLVLVDRAAASALPHWASAGLLVAVWALLAREWRTDPPGFLCLLLVWLLKWLCLSQMHAARPAALLFAPLLGRWCIVVMATGARDAAAPGRKLNSGITFREFALTSVIAGSILMTLAQFLGLVVFACVGGIVLGLRLVVHRWPGGVSWPLLLGSSQIVELLVLALLAALSGGAGH